MIGGNILVDLVEPNPLTQERSQRLHVEDPAHHGWPLAVEEPLAHPAKATPHQPAHAHAIHVLHGEAGPTLPQTPDGGTELPRMRRERNRVDRARRHAGVNRNIEIGPTLGDGAQHTYLVGGPSTPARQDESEI
jgi:hypothetical protein